MMHSGQQQQRKICNLSVIYFSADSMHQLVLSMLAFAKALPGLFFFSHAPMIHYQRQAVQRQTQV